MKLDVQLTKGIGRLDGGRIYENAERRMRHRKLKRIMGRKSVLGVDGRHLLSGRKCHSHHMKGKGDSEEEEEEEEEEENEGE